MSGPQSTLSGVVSLWVSERPSVMTSAIRLLVVDGSSWFRVYCRASPVNVPPASHRSFLMALWGGRSGSAQAGLGAGTLGDHRGADGRAHGTHSLSSWKFLMPGLRRSTCSCIRLWLYCTTPACDWLGSNCGHSTPRSGVDAGLPAAPSTPHRPRLSRSRGRANAAPGPGPLPPGVLTGCSRSGSASP